MVASRTRTSIANMACDLLSVAPIGSIEERQPKAQSLNRNYEEAVETVLSEFPWLAGKSRAILQQVSLVGQAPQDGTGYLSAYSYPLGCLRPLTINDRPIDEIYWEVETVEIYDQFGAVVANRKVIYCDVPGPISLKFAKFVEPGDMTAHLAKACAIELAMRCEATITNSTSRSQKLRQEYTDTTKGSAFRIGGYQVDTRSENPKPQRKMPTAGQKARAGWGM